MNIFISQAMHGVSDETVNAIRTKITNALNEICRFFNVEKFVILDQFNIEDDVPENCKNPRISRLGRSLRIMADADLVIFIGDYNSAKGCKIEFNVCEEYGIDHIEVNADSNIDNEIFNGMIRYLSEKRNKDKTTQQCDLSEHVTTFESYSELCSHTDTIKNILGGVDMADVDQAQINYENWGTITPDEDPVLIDYPDTYSTPSTKAFSVISLIFEEIMKFADKEITTRVNETDNAVASGDGWIITVNKQIGVFDSNSHIITTIQFDCDPFQYKEDYQVKMKPVFDMVDVMISDDNEVSVAIDSTVIHLMDNVFFTKQYTGDYTFIEVCGLLIDYINNVIDYVKGEDIDVS